MRHISLLCCVLVVMFIGACVPALPPSSDPPPLPSPAHTWTVRLTQTGGFVGVHLAAEVSSAGRLIAEDARSGAKIDRSLPASTVDRLAAAVSSVLVATPRAPSQSACADCFNYDLELSADGHTAHLHFDDVTLPGSAAEPLIALVRQLRDDALRAP